jgi:hypothetical protein
MDLVSPPGQTPLGREKDVLAGVDDAPNCHRTLRFALF